MTNHISRATIGASDIARMAGINRATVSNWRRRGVGFPSPIAGESSRPLFDLDEVTAWLQERGLPTDLESEPADEEHAPHRRRGKGHRPGSGRDHRKDRPGFRAQALLREHLDPTESKTFLIELMALVSLDRRGELPPGVNLDQPLAQVAQQAANQVAPSNPALAMSFTALTQTLNSPAIAGVARAVLAELSQVSDLAKLAERLSFRMSQNRFGTPAIVTTPMIAKLLAELAINPGGSQTKTPQTYAVLGCGTGGIPAQLARATGAHVTGWDSVPHAIELAAAHLAITSNGAFDQTSTTVAVRDLLADPPLEQTFDAVICDPPFRPGTMPQIDSRLLGEKDKPQRFTQAPWLALAQNMVTPEGRTVMTLPLDSWAGLNERESLLERGQVEVLIGLPEHSFANYRGRAVVLVLRGTAQPQDPSALVIDIAPAQKLAQPQRAHGGRRGSLSEEIVAQVVDLVHAFRSNSAFDSATDLPFGLHAAVANTNTAKEELGNPTGYLSRLTPQKMLAHGQHSTVLAQRTIAHLTQMQGSDELTNIVAELHRVAGAIDALTAQVAAAETAGEPMALPRVTTLGELGLEINRASVEQPAQPGDIAIRMRSKNGPRFVALDVAGADRATSRERLVIRGSIAETDTELVAAALNLKTNRETLMNVRMRAQSPRRGHHHATGREHTGGRERVAGRERAAGSERRSQRGKVLVETIMNLEIPLISDPPTQDLAQALIALEQLQGVARKLSWQSGKAAQSVAATLGMSQPQGRAKRSQRGRQESR